LRANGWPIGQQSGSMASFFCLFGGGTNFTLNDPGRNRSITPLCLVEVRAPLPCNGFGFSSSLCFAGSLGIGRIATTDDVLNASASEDDPKELIGSGCDT
jgi:hypothetical protein